MTIPLLAICCLLATLSALFSMSESALTALDVLRLRVDALGKKSVTTQKNSAKSDIVKTSSNSPDSLPKVTSAKTAFIDSSALNSKTSAQDAFKDKGATLTKKRALRVMKLLRKKSFVINTLLVANDLVNLALSSIFTLVAMRLFGAAALPVASSAATVVLLIFGEITPKTFVIRNPTLCAYKLSLFITVVVAILAPLSTVYNAVANAFLTVLSPKKKQKVHFTKDDVRSYLASSPLVKNAFDFTTLRARDIMTPRQEVVLFSTTTTFSQVLTIAQEVMYSYYPVYRNNIDDIVGVLYLKDLLSLVGKIRPNDPISTWTIEDSNSEHLEKRSILRKALFVPGTNKMSTIIALLEKERQSFAIVSDEYGGVDGILTKRNIAARVFNLAKKEAKIFSGTTLLSDISEALSIPLKSNICSTLGGYLTEVVGDFPKAGDTINAFGYRFVVVKASERAVLTVRIERILGEKEASYG